MSDIGELEIQEVPEIIPPKPKQKKTPEQLANLAKGRMKRMEQLKKEKENTVKKWNKQTKVERIEELSDIESSYTYVDPELPHIKAPEPEKEVNYPELESFVFDCMDKYFERFSNTKNMLVLQGRRGSTVYLIEAFKCQPHGGSRSALGCGE